MIEDAALWLAGAAACRRATGASGSWASASRGGLSIVAAGRPALRDRRRVRAVVRRPRRSAAHAALPLHRHPARRHAPAAARLRRGDHSARRRRPGRAAGAGRSRCGAAILRSSKRRGWTWSTRPQRGAEFARARTLADALPEPSRTLMTYVNDRDVAHLGPMLAAARGRRWAATRRCRPIAAPPPPRRSICCTAPTTTSSRRSNRRCWPRTLRDAACTVHLLATPLITHAEVDRAATVARRWRWSASGPRSSRNDTGARPAPAGAFGAVARAADSDAAAGRRASRSAAISSGDSSRKSPGRSRSSVIGPIATRRRRSTGWPIASHMLRTCRLRPSRTTIDSSV